MGSSRFLRLSGLMSVTYVVSLPPTKLIVQFRSILGTEALLEYSFVRVPGQTANADSVVENGDVHPPIGPSALGSRSPVAEEDHTLP